MAEFQTSSESTRRRGFLGSLFGKNREQERDADGGEAARAQSSELHREVERGEDNGLQAPNLERTRRGGKPMSGAQSVKILQDAFGSYKTMVQGEVRLLKQDEFKAAFQEIYAGTKFDWDTYVVPTHGNLNGIAYKGVSYVNIDTANTGTVPHEMLHVNTAKDWTPVVGSRFNEGATDYLKQHALKKANLSSPNSYKGELSVVTKAVNTGIGEDNLFKAYLLGGARTLIKGFVDQHCVGTWDEVKEAMDEHDWALAKQKLDRKDGSAPAEPENSKPKRKRGCFWRRLFGPRDGRAKRVRNHSEDR